MKKWQKIIISITGALSILIGLGLLILNSLFGDMCGNEIYSQMLSPDKKHNAIIFERNCGATTGFSTQVSIIKASKSLPNEHGNIYITDGHPKNSGLKLEWASSAKLIISNTEQDAYKEANWRNIGIEYK